MNTWRKEPNDSWAIFAWGWVAIICAYIFMALFLGTIAWGIVKAFWTVLR